MDSTNITSHGSEWPLFKYNDFPTTHIWAFCAYVFWMPHMARMIKSRGYAKAHHYHRSLLVVHAAVSLVEVVLFHAKSWRLGHEPRADSLDLWLCAVQTLTSLVMTERMRFVPKLTLELNRAAFQCMAFQRVLASGLSVYLGSPEWHRASIKMLSSFVWVRFLIMSSVRLAGINNYQQGYSIGLISGILMAMYEGSYPHGIAIFVGVVASLMALDRWASKFDNSAVDTLRFFGLVSHRADKSNQEPEKSWKRED